MDITEKLKFYLEKKKNVLLIGTHGVGKTEIIKKVFNESGLKWKYFSGPTMDPWINFVGVPKEVDGKLKFILPEDFHDDSVEGIYVDETNRAHKAIRNAMMELIQFKSINGREFKNLKVVWGSINPEEDESYDVERLDAALKDRFHVQLEVPSRPNVEYFENKFGDLGRSGLEWWSLMPEEAQKKVPPRRLDYALEIYQEGGDIRDCLPQGVNHSSLIKHIGSISIIDKATKAFKENDTVEGKKVVKDHYTELENWIYTNPAMTCFFGQLLEKEKITALISDDNSKFLESALSDYYKFSKDDGVYKDNIWDSIKTTHSVKMSEYLFKCSHGNNTLIKKIYSTLNTLYTEIKDYDFDSIIKDGEGKLEVKKLGINNEESDLVNNFSTNIRTKDKDKIRRLIMENFVESNSGEYSIKLFPESVDSLKLISEFCFSLPTYNIEKYIKQIVAIYIANSNPNRSLDKFKADMASYPNIWKKLQPFGITKYVF